MISTFFKESLKILKSFFILSFTNWLDDPITKYALGFTTVTFSLFSLFISSDNIAAFLSLANKYFSA